jgi:hypothetical protein
MAGVRIFFSPMGWATWSHFSMHALRGHFSPSTWHWHALKTLEWHTGARHHHIFLHFGTMNFHHDIFCCNRSCGIFAFGHFLEGINRGSSHPYQGFSRTIANIIISISHLFTKDFYPCFQFLIRFGRSHGISPPFSTHSGHGSFTPITGAIIIGTRHARAFLTWPCLHTFSLLAFWFLGIQQTKN